MGNLFCPNIKSEDYQEMVEAFNGNVDYVHYLWNKNNGNPMYNDHKGNPSLLWEDLLTYTDGDRAEAIRLKSTMFNYKFIDRFGDWIKYDYTPETNNVYDNGEPQMDNILDVEVMKEKKPGHADPEVAAAIDRYNKRGEKFGIVNLGESLITDNNNPYSWKIEEELGLVKEFKRRAGEPISDKFYNGFIDSVAREKIKQAEKLGGWGYFIPQVDGTFGVGVGYKIGRPVKKQAGKSTHGNIVNLAGIDFVVDEADSRKIRTTLKQIEEDNTDALSRLARLMGFFAREFNAIPEIKEAANLFLSNRLKAPNIGIIVKDRNENNDYMEYDPATNSIILYSQTIMEDPTSKGFVASFVHEIGHAFLTKAIDAPTTKADLLFKSTMEQIYSDVKLHSVLNGSSNEYGLKNVHEFMTTFLNDSKFAADLDRYNTPRTFYQRIIDAIAEFFLSFTGYDFRKNQGDSLRNYVEKTITNYINKTSSYYNSNSYKEGVIYQKHKAAVRQSYEDIKRMVDPSHPVPENTVKALEALENLFDIKRTETEHSYKEKGTNIYFKSATELMAEAGLGINMTKLGEQRKANIKRSGRIGTAVHITLQGKTKKITEDILKETGFVMSADASKMVSDVLKDIRKLKGLEGKDVTVLSEVFIADPYKQVAGSIDLVIIDPRGRVHLFDFKTKEGTWSYYNKPFAGGYSDLQRDQTQLGIYKHMFEKTIGIPVASMNVVMLKATISKDTTAEGDVYNTIGSVVLDPSVNGTGVDIFDKENTLVKRIYGERTAEFNWSSYQADLVEDKDYKNSIEYQVKTIDAKKLSPVEKIHRDTVKILEDKLEIIRKRYAYSRYREFEEFVNKVAQESSTSVALSAIITYAAEISNKYIARIIDFRKRGLSFTPEMLVEYKDYITAYEPLTGLSILLKENPNLLNEPGIIELLDGKDGIRANLDKIRDVFETEGKVIIAKKYTPLYNGFKVRRREELEKKYRRLKFRFENKKGEKEIFSEVYGVKENLTEKELDMFLKGTTMEDYVNANLLIEADALDRLTFEMLLRQLSVASSDVNELARWAVTLQEVSDPIISAMMSDFTIADEKRRVEALKKRVEIVRILRKVEQARGRTSFTSEKKLWKSILEEINGENTNYLIRPWLSILDEEEKAVRKSNRTKTEKKAREDMTAWNKDNFPLEKFQDEYFMAFRSYLNKLVQANQLKADEAEAIMENETDKYPKPITALSEWTVDQFSDSDKKTVPPLISDEAADIALQWRTKNRKLFSDINQKWVNPQWEAFMKEVGVDTSKPVALQMEELEKSDNPMAQMYTMLTKLAETGDSFLPYHYRLGYRLPGMSKSKNERLREGQKLSTAVKETVSIGFLKRAEDTLYQDSKEFTDEKGNPKYFLPIHFTARLSTEEQSYDLPTIYFKFWEMANDHHHKAQILPRMEMAKYFVQTRKTERKTALGERMMRAMRGGRKATEEDVSLSNVNSIAPMLEDWFQMYVYGNNTVESKFKLGNYVVDGQKLASSMMGFVSVNLLAFNVVQGFANISIGEVMTGIDAIAGEWINPKSLAYGTKMYAKWLPGMAADMGSRAPSNVGSLLIERWNVLSEDQVGETNLSNATKMKAMFNTSALSVFQIGGEHWLRVRPLFAMLHELRAIDKEGKDIGPMIDQYYVDDGELMIRDNVDLKASKWTEEDQLKFGRKFHGIMYRLHGAYGYMERVAAQRYILGQLAYMYRKFVMPGIKRRYGKMEYIERMQQSVEGNYVTTAKFFARVAREMHGLQLSIMGEEWAALSPHEKANIKRTLGEVSSLIAIITLANFAYSSWDDADDPDEARFWAYIAYQAYRLKAELLFYSPKLDETMSLLRSPTATMSLAENTIKLTDQLFSPFEVYERGPWKGHLKLERDVVQFVPVYKQFYKVRDIEEQIQWFR